MPRILLLATVPPWPPSNGGQQRANLLLRALSACAEVDVACVFQAGGIPAEHLAETANHCRFVGHLPWEDQRLHWTQRATKRLGGWLGYPRTLNLIQTNLLRDRFRYLPDPLAAKWLNKQCATTRYDAIVSRYLTPLCKTDAFQQELPLLVDVDDLDSKHYETRAACEDAPWHARAVLRACARYCRSIQIDRFANCQHLWFVTEQDRQTFAGQVPASVLPNIPYLPPGTAELVPCPEASESQVLLTVGSMAYEPNRHGVDWFLQHVWPGIHQQVPTATYWIAGATDDTETSRWSAVPGVKLLGRVDDVRACYAQAAFSVAPILIGAGTKIKVLESLAYGRCCVATPHAYHGYEQQLPAGSGVIQAETAEAMTHACLRLLHDPSARARQAAEGQRLVAEHFTFPSFAVRVQTALENVLGTCSPRELQPACQLGLNRAG